ncbi:MAG: hypothetical protein ACHQVK_01470 [Candidatus Paceibacterales bacterium]
MAPSSLSPQHFFFVVVVVIVPLLSGVGLTFTSVANIQLPSILPLTETFPAAESEIGCPSQSSVSLMVAPVKVHPWGIGVWVFLSSFPPWLFGSEAFVEAPPESPEPFSEEGWAVFDMLSLALAGDVAGGGAGKGVGGV